MLFTTSMLCFSLMACTFLTLWWSHPYCIQPQLSQSVCSPQFHIFDLQFHSWAYIFCTFIFKSHFYTSIRSSPYIDYHKTHLSIPVPLHSTFMFPLIYPTLTCNKGSIRVIAYETILASFNKCSYMFFCSRLHTSSFYFKMFPFSHPWWPLYQGITNSSI